MDEPVEKAILVFGGLEIDPLSRVVRLNGHSFDLSTKEFDILYLLASHKEWALSREQIYTAVWHDEILVDNRAVENMIYRLRRKLRQAGGLPYIRALPGYGYKFSDK